MKFEESKKMNLKKKIEFLMKEEKLNYPSKKELNLRSKKKKLICFIKEIN